MTEERRLEFRVDGPDRYLIQIMGSAEFVLQQFQSLQQFVHSLNKKPAVLERSIDELEFSVRTYNGLKDAGCQTLGDIVTKTEHELLKAKNFGKKSLKELKEELGKMGLTLKEGGINGHQTETPGSGTGTPADLG